MRTRTKASIFLLGLALVFTSCNHDANNSNTKSVTISYRNLERTPHNGGVYYKIPAGKTEVIVTGLPSDKSDKIVSLVRLNTKPQALTNVASVTGQEYGGSRQVLNDAAACNANSNLGLEPSFDSIIYNENDNGPFEIPFIDTTDYESIIRELKANNSSQNIKPNYMVVGNSGSQNTFTVGATKNFFVEDGDEDDGQAAATLRYEGTYCYIWVADENFGTDEETDNDNIITLTQAQNLAAAFDALYPKETGLIGNSYTTNPDNTYFINPQAKISILVYDIQGDYASNQTGGSFGLFTGIDLFKKTNNPEYASSKSNEMELLYVDSYFTDRIFTSVVSTVAHEFEHMLYFVHKCLGQSNFDGNTWYTEMGAMMAEDCLATYLADAYDDFDIDVDSTLSRLKKFNADYYSGGLTYWGDGDDVYTSYAIAGIFGCWLQRNYGGEALIKKIVDNRDVDMFSIQTAIRTLGYPESFTDLFRKFALSFVQPQATSYTLNKSTRGNANGDYNLVAANPWDINYSNAYNISGQTRILYGPVYGKGNYSGIMRSYGFWITGWDASQWSGIKLVFSAATDEENYIVIAD